MDVVRRRPDQPKRAVQYLASTVKAVAEQRGRAAVPRATLFDVVLTNPGPNKIATRKALKAQLGLDLLQAYSAVEQTPSVLRTGITQAEAERLRAALASVGTVIEFRPSASAGEEAQS